MSDRQVMRDSRDRRGTSRFLGVWPVAILVGAASCALVFASWVQPWAELALLYRDLFATQGIARHVGLFSHLGAFLWCATAAVGMSTALILYELGGDARHIRLFGYFGALSGLLLADDFFMLHEASRSVLGLPPETWIGALGALVAVGLGLFRHDLVVLGWPLLAIALAFFGVSLAVDLFNDRVAAPKPRLIFFYEDAPKFCGIAFWAAFFVRASLLCIVSTSRSESSRYRPQPLHGRRRGEHR